jgi:hypothetical protein
MMPRIKADESGFPCGSHDRSRLARRRETGIATMPLDCTIAQMVIDRTAYHWMELRVPEKVRHFEAPAQTHASMIGSGNRETLVTEHGRVKTSRDLPALE